MTPALKAMVEAMAAELVRQGEAGDLADVGFDPASSTFTIVGVCGGEFDLEKVARAGLAAIREPDETIRAGAAAADAAADPFIGTEHEGVPADPADAVDHWRFMIAAILGSGEA